MRFWRIVLVGALVAAMLVVGGCGAIAKKAVEGATGISVDEGDDSVTIKGDDGSELNMNTGEGELAEGFPDTIPVYDGKIVDSAGFTTNDASTWTANIETSDSIDDVKAFYADELAAKGWKITLDMDSNDASGGRTVAYSAENGDLALTVTIGATDGKTQIGMLAGTKSE